MWPHDIKLGRAREHLRQLRGALDRWHENGYEIQVVPDPQPPDFAVAVRLLRDVDGDTSIPLLIGDFLQNARAALDYVAYALGEQGAASGMDEIAARNSSFPIIGDVDNQGYSGRGPDLFTKAATRALATVEEPARRAIEQLQPYYVGGQVWDWEPLWVLHELARHDRHRFLQLTAIQSGDLELDPARTRNVRVSKFDIPSGRFFREWDEETREEIASRIATLTAIKANPNEPMQLHFRSALHVGFDIDSLPATVAHLDDASVGLTLSMIEMNVRRVLETLRPFLPAEPPY